MPLVMSIDRPKMFVAIRIIQVFLVGMQIVLYIHYQGSRREHTGFTLTSELKASSHTRMESHNTAQYIYKRPHHAFSL